MTARHCSTSPTVSFKSYPRVSLPAFDTPVMLRVPDREMPSGA